MSTLESSSSNGRESTVINDDHPLPKAAATSATAAAAAAAAAATTKKISRLLCPECRARPVLYQCPRCRRRTCSLDCCRAHKTKYQCNGKRDKTAFVNLGSMTDATLASDYHFLEEIIGQMDSHSSTTTESKRRRTNHAANNEPATASSALSSAAPLHPLLQASCNSVPGRIQTLVSLVRDTSPHTNDETIQRHRHKPSHPRGSGGGTLNPFQQRAAMLGITVLRLPDALERHQRNQSHVKMIRSSGATHRNETSSIATINGRNDDRVGSGKKKPELYWTVEWCWYHPKAEADANSITTANANDSSSRKADISSDRSRMTSGLLHNIAESQSLTDLIQRIIQESTFTGLDIGTLASSTLDDVSILVPKIPSSAHRPVFVAIASPPLHSHHGGTMMTLVEALRDLTVIEYPTLHIVPPDRRHEFVVDTIPMNE
jgi:hypothetical protein